MANSTWIVLACAGILAGGGASRAHTELRTIPSLAELLATSREAASAVASSSAWRNSRECSRNLPELGLVIAIPCDDPPGPVGDEASANQQPQSAKTVVAVAQSGNVDSSIAPKRRISMRQKCSDITERAQLEPLRFEDAEDLRNGCK
jgi:hypothetical protein